MTRIKFRYIIILVFLLLLGSIFVFNDSKGNNVERKKVDINKVLNTKAYSYLPETSKEYIKEVYEKTGELIYTEKNKETNKPYLNPSYVKYLEYSEEQKEEIGEIPIALVVDYTITDVDGASLPSSYDLRNVGGKNFVTPIRDQGSLGICWAFTSAGAAETYLLKKNNTSYSSSSRLFAERQMDYAAASNGIKDYNSEYATLVDRELGDGGNFYISTLSMASGVSLVDYNGFKPFNDEDFEKMELADVLSHNKSLYEVNATINMPELELRESTGNLTSAQKETRTNYINTIKQNIMDHGAAYVGTYMDSACRYTDTNLNNTVIDVYECNNQGGHAMEIIGWNDNLQYSYCADLFIHKSSTTNCTNVVSGKGVWILKNSWGNVIQYPYLTYDSLESSIHFITDMSSTSSKNWSNNYLLGGSENGYSSKTYLLSDSKIRNNETIKKVKFIGLSSDTTFTVKVRKTNGTYETVTKSVSLPGLVTVDIPNNVVVNSNTTISITGSGGYFFDKLIVFTSNNDSTPFVDVESFNNMNLTVNQRRFYSETKNIPSGSTITYKVYDSNNVDVSNKVAISNNVVAENNVNTLAYFDNSLAGSYTVKAMYNGTVAGTFNINIIRMSGSGTASSPYIVTNGAELSQIRNNLGAYYELGNDIDLTNDTRDGGSLSDPSDVCPQGFGWQAINGFYGSLDGKGHTIKGLYQNNYAYCVVDDTQYWQWSNGGNGLFGNVRGSATIKNLILDDFDITCHDGYCGALVSNYISNMDENGDIETTDTTAYTANFKNIAIKNSHVQGAGDDDLYGSGLFGYLESYYGTINIDGVYLDITRDLEKFNTDGYLANYVSANSTNISNVRLTGDIKGNNTDGSTNSVLIYDLYANNPVTIKNILSTVTATNVKANLLGNIYGDQLTVSNVNILKNNLPLCPDNKCSSATNVKVFDKSTQLVEFTRSTNYSTWNNFSTNWQINTVDSVTRIPVLKFMSFNYTYIADINLYHQLNTKKSFLDYITPDIDAAMSVSIRSNNDSVLTIDDDLNLIPQKSASTTIHVESLYDGYIKDIPINVVYVPHYTIHFDGNGGTGEMADIEVPAGSNYTLPRNAFVKDGYEIKEWNTKADGKGTTYSNLGQVSGLSDKTNITLYVQWTGAQNTVSFDANGGTVYPLSKLVRTGEKYGELPIPERTGYGFEGWSCEEFVITSDSEYNCDNLVAQWISNSYTIVYDANGGTKDPNSTDYYNFVSDTKFTDYTSYNYANIESNPFVREGYLFKEWNTKADGTGDSYARNTGVNFNNVVGSNIYLYAIWRQPTPDNYTVHFNANGGTGTMSDYTYPLGGTGVLPNNTLTRNNYTFKKWCTNANGTGTCLGNKATITNLFGTDEYEKTLYAIWEEKQYTIHFNANGGTGTMADYSYGVTGTGTLPANTLTRNNYNFKKWCTNANGTGTCFGDKATVTNLFSSGVYEKTLYAIWEEKQYTVHFNSNGGTGIMLDYSYGVTSTGTLPENTFTREYFTFKKWCTNPNGNGTCLDNEATITNLFGTGEYEKTLYAIWESNLGTVTFKSNFGSNGSSTQTFTLGANFTLNKNQFVRSGFVFTKWNTKADGTGESYNDQQTVSFAQNITLYAIWQESGQVVPYVINNYVVDETNNYISGITVGTDLNTFKGNIVLGTGYTVTVDTKTVNNKQVLYTGGKTKIMYGSTVYKEFTNVVTGDINGDGIVDSADLLRIRQKLLNIRTLSDYSSLAADINYDNKIDSADLLRVRQHLLGIRLIK